MLRIVSAQCKVVVRLAVDLWGVIGGGMLVILEGLMGEVGHIGRVSQGGLSLVVLLGIFVSCNMMLRIRMLCILFVYMTMALKVVRLYLQAEVVALPHVNSTNHQS